MFGWLDLYCCIMGVQTLAIFSVLNGWTWHVCSRFAGISRSEVFVKRQYDTDLMSYRKICGKWFVFVWFCTRDYLWSQQLFLTRAQVGLNFSMVHESLTYEFMFKRLYFCWFYCKLLEESQDISVWITTRLWLFNIHNLNNLCSTLLVSYCLKRHKNQIVYEKLIT
jgi:hypothetical protein